MVPVEVFVKLTFNGATPLAGLAVKLATGESFGQTRNEKVVQLLFSSVSLAAFW